MKQKKDLLYIVMEFPPFPGGIASYSYNMVKTSANLGKKVVVLTLKYSDTKKTFPGLPKNVEIIRIADMRDKFGKLGRIFTIINMIVHVYKLVRKYRFKIIHVGDLTSIRVISIMHKFYPLNYMTTFYGSELKILNDKLKQGDKSGWLDGCKSAHCISNFTLLLVKENQYLNNKIQKDKIKLNMAYLGVDQEFAKVQNDPKFVLEKYNIDQDKIKILSVSRLEERKGHIDAIKALNLLPKNVRDKIVYILVGKKLDEMYTYTTKVQEALKNSKFSYRDLGVVPFEDLKALYNIADIFLLPGKKHTHKVEGFGLVYLEAAICGVPSVAYKLNAVPEVVLDGKTGLLVDYPDVKALSNAVYRLVVDSDLRERLAKNAKKYAKTFTWKKCVKRVWWGK